MHGNNLIHRDIKASNTLLTREGPSENRRVRPHSAADGKEPQAELGGWDAVLDGPRGLPRLKYDYKADVWSTGVLAIECAEGFPPLFNETEDYAMFLTATKGQPRLKVPHEWSREFHDFIAKCTVFDPTKRPTAAEMLLHPFLRCAAAADRLGRICSVVAEFREEQRGKNRIQWLKEMLESEDKDGPITPDLSIVLHSPVVPVQNSAPLA